MRAAWPRANGLRDAPLGELVKGLAGDVSLLVRQEGDLARAELREKARVAGPGLGLLAGAAVFGLGAFGALTACLILAIDLAIPAWAAALAVTVLWAAVAGALVSRGRERLRAVDGAMPRATAETVQEDIDWASRSIGRGTSSRAAADDIARRRSA